METSPCEPDARYSAARSAPPVQIPDDLSPPDESDALRLPPDSGDAGAQPTAGDCLEAPPSFFGESRPFEVSSEDDEGESRRERRERRRAERREAEAPAAEPAPPPASDDRVIDN